MKELIHLLTSCETLLRSVGENFWANKINTVLQKGGGCIGFYGLEEILSWYGGMGSFNDLIISKFNDHLIEVRNEEKLNDELNRLRSNIYQKVINLKRG